MTNRYATIDPWKLSAAELAILHPKPAPAMRDWLPENLLLPRKETRLAGQFSFEYSPWMRGPCDWFCDPAVREITLLGPLQFGKTLFMTACLAYAVRWMPMPTMLVMANHQSLNKRMKRLRPMFEANGFLMDQLDGNLKNLNVGESTELKDLLLVLAWVTSDAALAESPEGIILADEVALWPATVQNSDLSPLGHLRGRQETYDPVRKLVKVSSAREVGDLADQEFEAGDACELWAPCHKCSFWHIPRWHDSDNPKAHAVLDREKDGSWLYPAAYATGEHVRYVCPSCGTEWSDHARGANLQRCVWLPRGVTMGRAGRIEGEIKPTAYKSARVRGIQIPPKLRSIKKMAADWVRGQIQLKTGNTGGLKHFLNNQEAVSWRDAKAVTDESLVRKHIGTYRSEDILLRGASVPWGVQAVILAVDVHDTWFRLVALGFGWMFESWRLADLTIQTTDTKEQSAYAALLPWLVRMWPLADGGSIPPAAVGIDSGYQTEPVKTFCRANRQLVHNGRLLPVRGSPRKMDRMWKLYPEDKTFGVYEINPLSTKDQLFRNLFETENPGPGYMHIPADITGEIVCELASEHKVAKDGRPVWVQKKDGRDNHAWDASAYALCLAHIVGVGTLSQLPEQPRIAPVIPKRINRDERESSSFTDGLPKLF